MNYVIFRAGAHLLMGQVLEAVGGAYMVSVQFDTARPKAWLGGVPIPCHEGLVLRKFDTFEECETLVGCPGQGARADRRDGKNPYHVFEMSVKLPDAVLDAPGPQVSGPTLEAIRGRLTHLGFLKPKEPVLGAYGEAKAFYAFMKTDPFRDVCKIQDGTVVEITDYYKGCAVVEADGEVFWVPVEETKFIESKPKDLDYYFRLDKDNDKVPDPLISLPSHDQLKASGPSAPGVGPADNWNCYPQQPKVAGNLFPLQDIDMDDVSILRDELPPRSKYTSAGLREGAGAASTEFYHYYQQHKPGLHGLGGPSIRDVADALVKGAPVEVMFLKDFDYQELERAYLEAFSRVYPGVVPEVSHLKALVGTA